MKVKVLKSPEDNRPSSSCETEHNKALNVSEVEVCAPEMQQGAIEGTEIIILLRANNSRTVSIGLRAERRCCFSGG